MPIVDEPEETFGNFWPNRSAARAISSPPSTTSHSPFPCTPFVWRQSSEYSPIAKETSGFCSTCLAVVDCGRTHM